MPRKLRFNKTGNTDMNRSRARLLAGTALCCLAWPAWAQDPAPETDTEEEAVPATVPPPTSFITLDEITVLATRRAESPLEVPRQVTVISDEEIQERGIDSIQEMVRYIPGVEVQSAVLSGNPYGDTNGFTIRGVDGNRVLVMVDGSRQMERITDFGRDLVDPGLMGKVEIIRGPASVLWGADAMGGVVLFETLKPDDILDDTANNYGGRVSAAWDSVNNAFTETFVAAGEAGPWQMLIGIQRRDYEQVTNDKLDPEGGDWAEYFDGCPRPEPAIKCDEYNPATYASDNALATLIYTGLEEHTFELTAEFYNRRTHIDQLDNITGELPTGTSTLATERDQDIRRFRISIGDVWEPVDSLIERVEARFSYHPQHIDREATYWTRTGAGVYQRREDVIDYSEDFYTANIQADLGFDLGPTRHEVTLGFDGSYTEGGYDSSRLTYDDETGALLSELYGVGFNFSPGNTTRADLFIQDEVSIFDGMFTLTPGVRLATYALEPEPAEGYVATPGAEPKDKYGERLLFNVSAEWQIDDNLSVYGTYAEGFKMPTAQQLFQSYPAFDLIPNPNLKPEDVTTWEVGARAVFDDFFVSVAAYTSDYKNFIVNFVETDGPEPGVVYLTYDNLSSVKIWGIEANAEWNVDRNWTLKAAASYQYGDQKADEESEWEPFARAIPLRVVGGVRWTSDDDSLMLELTGTYQDAFTRVPEGNFEPPSSFVLDAIARWSPLENVDLTVGLYNITDERYYAPWAATYTEVPGSAAIAAQSPLEFAIQPGFNAQLGATIRF